MVASGWRSPQLKNKFASPTPLGYRDMNLNVRVSARRQPENISPRIQLNLKSVADAKHIAHEQYEDDSTRFTEDVRARASLLGALEAIAGRLRARRWTRSDLARAEGRRADALRAAHRRPARSDELARSTLQSVGALPAGLDESSQRIFRRVFVDDGAWGSALPLVELCVPRPSRSPLTRRVVRWAGIERGARRSVMACRCCSRYARATSLVFYTRTVTDWLTGEAPFDKRSSSDAFFVARDAAHRGLARACARAIRAGVLNTESYSSDAALRGILCWLHSGGRERRGVGCSGAVACFT